MSPARPKLVNQDTGEVKVDRNGETVFQVDLSAANEMGRVELLNVSVSGDQAVTVGQLTAGLWAWRRWQPVSFWYGIGFPMRAVPVYLTWHHVASGCRLTRMRRRWRLGLDAPRPEKFF